MDIKQVIGLLFVLSTGWCQTLAQNNESDPRKPFDLYKEVLPTPFMLNIETSTTFYKHTEIPSYSSFGFGAGGEYFFYTEGNVLLSAAVMLNYIGAKEELKTYRVENGDYYYRSTTLTGQLAVGIPFMLKYQIGESWRVGAGFQIQFGAKTFQNQFVHGLPASPIPDIQFSKSQSSVLAFIGHRIDRRHQVNLIGQFGVSRVIQGLDDPTNRGIRLQISRGMFML